MLSLISLYVIFIYIAITFFAFYYLYAKYFGFSNNQNETSEDLHNTSTVPPSCFQRTNPVLFNQGAPQLPLGCMSEKGCIGVYHKNPRCAE